MNEVRGKRLNLHEGTYRKEGGEIKSYPYYSRYTVVNNTNPARVWDTKLGGTNFTRLDQTNMPDNGKIPNSQKYIVGAFGLRYQPGALKSTTNLLAVLSWLGTTAFEFWIQDKTVMYQNTLARMMGLTIPLVHTDAATSVLVDTLKSEAKMIVHLDDPITLTANTIFYGLITPGVASGAQAATDGDYLDVAMYGRVGTR